MVRGPYTWGDFIEVACRGCGARMANTDDAVVYAEPLPAEPKWYHGACWDALSPAAP
jgi:hypothetical protein